MVSFGDDCGLKSRKVLCGTSSETPFRERIEIASGIALAVLSMHALCFVHKSIRPEDVLIFSSSEAVGKPYHVGLSIIATGTRLRGDDHKEKNLYPYLLRQGVQIEDEYIMQHDVCSLGVVLPEIGLNTSVLVWPHDPRCLPVPNPQLELADQTIKRNGGFSWRWESSGNKGKTCCHGSKYS